MSVVSKKVRNYDLLRFSALVGYEPLCEVCGLRRSRVALLALPR